MEPNQTPAEDSDRSKENVCIVGHSDQNCNILITVAALGLSALALPVTIIRIPRMKLTLKTCVVQSRLKVALGYKVM